MGLFIVDLRYKIIQTGGERLLRSHTNVITEELADWMLDSRWVTSAVRMGFSSHLAARSYHDANSEVPRMNPEAH